MYSVKLMTGTEIITVHYPNPSKDTPKFLKLNLNKKKSVPEQLTFTIPIQNAGYSKIYDLVTFVQVYDTRDNTLRFEGRVISSPRKMDNTGQFYKEVVCEGELAYLNDTNTRAWDLSGMILINALQLIVDNHNSHTTSDKQFVLGRVDVTGVLDIQANYEKSLNFIIDKFVNKFGGVLKVRKENSIRYLDYTGLVGQQSTTKIKLGYNMQDMILDEDVTNIATRVVPVGKDGTTIETVNNGKDYLEDAESVAQYGIIEQIADLKDIEDVNLLKAAGQEYLDNAKKAKIKLQLTAVNLNVLNLTIDDFEVGNDYKVENEVLNVDDYFTVIEIDEDLLDPWNSKLTIDNKFETMTDRQINMQRAANALDAVLTAQGKLNTYFLQGIIDTLKNQLIASGAYQNAQVIEGKGILLENTNAASEDYGALYLGPGIFSIAKDKIGGAWNWRTWGTGKGFVADLIVTGLLVGGKVQFNLDQGTLLIGNSKTDYNLYFDGTDLKLVGRDYSFDGQTFTLGKSGDTAQHTKDYSQWTHSDGTLTKISADGLQHINGATKKEYHYLNYKGEVVVNNNQSVTVQLPDEFKGKEFSVSYSIKNYNVSGIVIGFQGLYSSENYSNGTVIISPLIIKLTPYIIGSNIAYNNFTDGTITVEYSVIA
ncbi:MAG: phage tail protein [Bacillota bacterium]|nr:phage tail protein [Bacillota bacterium]